MTLEKTKFRKSKKWAVCGLALVSFAAGSLVTARLAHVREVRADADHVFELRVYHVVPGKLTVMESRFRNTTSKLLAKHNLNVVGYWTTDSNPQPLGNTFVFLLMHSSLEEAKKNWGAMAADPAFQEIIKEEQNEKTLEKAEITYMTPTDFSAMK
jgi:hypothetical protein